jgi:mevalonate kinase
MPALSASAPGKIILLGEHAVVHGRPAIAVPVTQVQAKAIIQANPSAERGSIQILAPAIGLEAEYHTLEEQQPIRATIHLTLQALQVTHVPACTLRISSTIPVASGLGSGAAVAVAVIRVLSSFLGKQLSDQQVSSIAFEIEKIHHGTPSGIDNSVVTFNKPIYFLRGQPIEMLRVPRPFTLVIGNTGIASPTSLTVSDVLLAWQENPQRVDAIFDEITYNTQQARTRIETGDPDSIGPLLSRNHQLLRELGVSSNELDCLVQAALKAGALGAKLSGGGRGGNMIALVSPDKARPVIQALMQAGAESTLSTVVSQPSN